MVRSHRTAYALASAFLLAGCTTLGPDYVEPEIRS
jgi:hypothetical protein